MKLLVALLCLAIYCSSCSSEKEKEGGPKAPSTDNDFTQQFKPLELRFSIGDTSLDKNIAAEKPLKIIGKTYFPDSLIYKYFERGSKINYYPIGKVQNAGEEIYVLMKAISGNRKAAYILVYDNKLTYKDGTMICQTDGDNKTTYFSSIDKYFNITIRRTDLIQGQEPLLTELFLAYNNIGKLGTVVTNDTDEQIALQNPIDTLKQTKKFTGDYYLDKNNMISLRDSKDSGELVFFYHFEKDKQNCIGEIKDKLKMTGATTAVYMRDGDPCVINFQFTNNTIKVIEESGCGNKKNSFDCTLNGTFQKNTKKAATPKTKEPTTHGVNPLGAKPATTTPTPTATTPTATKPNKPATKPLKPAVKPAVKPTATPTKPVVKQPDIQ